MEKTEVAIMKGVVRITYLVWMVFCLCANASTKQVAITIDDLPGWANYPVSAKENLKKIAEVFKKESVPTTGFVIGSLGSESVQNMEALEFFAKSGLHLANHSWAHKKYSTISKEDFLSELSKTENFLKPYRKRFGPWPLSFRFPMLDQGDTEEKKEIANNYFIDNKMLLAHVSIDTSDWAFAQYYNQFLVDKPSAIKKIEALYLEHIFDCVEFSEEASQKIFSKQIPQILLIHANSLNAAMLAKIIEGFRQRQYKFISLAEALNDSAYLPYKYKIAYQPADHFFFHMSHVLGIQLPKPDRTSYFYFQRYWEPKIKTL